MSTCWARLVWLFVVGGSVTVSAGCGSDGDGGATVTGAGGANSNPGSSGGSAGTAGTGTGGSAMGGVANTGGFAGSMTGGLGGTSDGGRAGAPGGSGGAVSAGGSAVGGAVSGGQGGADDGCGVPLWAGGAGGEGGAGGFGGEGDNRTPSGALLKYDFEDASGKVVTDGSGYGNHGTAVNTTFTAKTDGRNGAAASFSATDSSVSVPRCVLSRIHELTVSAWVYLTANPAGNRLFDFGGSATSGVYFTFNNGASGTELGLRSASGTRTLVTNTQLPLNVWKHVAVTLSSSGTVMYVDGGVVARSTTLVIDPAAIWPTTNLIGASLTPGDPALAGRIDEFYIYPRVLRLNEIRQLAWPKTDYSIWHFDETQGTVARDSSDNARDGTLIHPYTTPWTTGVYAGALMLYNANQTEDSYVQLPTGVVQNCTQGMTVSAWIRIATVFAQSKVFTFGNDSTSPKQFIYGRIMGGMTQSWVFMNGTDGSGAGDHTPNLNVTWTPGDWYHVAAVRDGQVLTLYLNGDTTGTSGTVNPRTMADTVPQPSAMGVTEINYIGKGLPSWNENEFHGAVDEFLLSCRPYQPDEIKQLSYRPQ